VGDEGLRLRFRLRFERLVRGYPHDIFLRRGGVRREELRTALESRRIHLSRSPSGLLAEGDSVSCVEIQESVDA
jgi:hypothetical protein